MKEQNDKEGEIERDKVGQAHIMMYVYKEKRSNSLLWQKPLYQIYRYN